MSNSQQIIDLDALIPADKKAAIGGVTYTIPGDMPLETFLRMQAIAQSEDNPDADEGEMVAQLKQAMFDLFAWKLPETATAERSKLQATLDGLGVKTFLAIFGEVYKGEIDEDDDVPPTSPPESEPETPGTPSSSPEPTAKVGSASLD